MPRGKEPNPRGFKSPKAAKEARQADNNKAAKLNKKLLARTSGTTKGEVRGVVHSRTGKDLRKTLLNMANGGKFEGVKKGSPAAKRAVKEVKSYLKATRKTRNASGGKKRG